jgi:hypothetical protein
MVIALAQMPSLRQGLAQSSDPGAGRTAYEVPYELFILESEGGDGPYPTSGLTPNERPAQAPVVSDAKKTNAWYRRALTGLEAPYPSSLRFLEDQGVWHTPFDHPGMSRAYDLRGWYGEMSEEATPIEGVTAR